MCVLVSNIISISSPSVEDKLIEGSVDRNSVGQTGLSAYIGNVLYCKIQIVKETVKMIDKFQQYTVRNMMHFAWSGRFNVFVFLSYC